jgi:hypothetical protein
MFDPITIGASLLGGLLGNRGASSGGQTTAQQSLPSWLEAYGPQYADQVYATSQLPYTPYGKDRVAGFTEDQLAGMDMTRQQANTYSPLFGQAENQLSKTINGDYLSPDSNPYLRGTYDAAAGRMADAYKNGTAAQTNAAAGFGGAFGGSAQSELAGQQGRAFGDSLGSFANQLYGGNYQAERSRQQQATQFAPTFAGAQQQYGFNNANALQGIGAQQQALGQQYINDDYSQFQEAMQYPYKQLDTFASMFNPNLGKTATSSQSTSPFMGTLGGALGGLGVARGLLGQQGGQSSNPYMSMFGNVFDSNIG